MKVNSDNNNEVSRNNNTKLINKVNCFYEKKIVALPLVKFVQTLLHKPPVIYKGLVI